MPFERNTSLSKKLSNLSLLVPLVFLGLCLVEISTGWLPTISTRAIIRYTVVTFLCMNIIHLSFTFQMLVSLDELKSWLKAEGARSFWWRCVFIFLGVFTLSAMMNQHIQVSQQYASLLLLGYFFVYDVLGARHLFLQSQGISLNSVFDTHSSRSNSGWTQQRKLFRFALYGLLLMIASHYVYREVHSWIGFYIIAAISCTILSLILLKILWVSRASPQRLFNLRFILWPLNAFFFARMGTMATHGVEYAKVFHTMACNSKTQHKSRKLLWSCVPFLLPTVASAIVIGVISIPGLVYAQVDQAPTHWHLFFDLNAASFFTHYYMDYRLFSMRNPNCRKWVAPLLASSTKG
jgi:hypothetical protein